MVHYDAARSAEVFVHRAGRTARARAAGLSLSIVAPRDDAHHRQTCSVLGLRDGMQAFPVEIRLVDRARERVGMALKASTTVKVVVFAVVNVCSLVVIRIAWSYMR